MKYLVYTMATIMAVGLFYLFYPGILPVPDQLMLTCRTYCPTSGSAPHIYPFALTIGEHSTGYECYCTWKNRGRK